MTDKLRIDVRSEIGELEGVILHTPGKEVENMTPRNAEKALYSDILNLTIAQREYSQFSGVLNKVTQTFQVTDLVQDILSNENVKHDLTEAICKTENVQEVKDTLMAMDSQQWVKSVFEGIPVERNTLSRYLNQDKYSLRPLHNFFFTRDASASMFNSVLICKMASSVRDRESLIMEAIFDHHPKLETLTRNPKRLAKDASQISIEGGDVQIGRDDVIVIGTGLRTSPKGIDFLIEECKKRDKPTHIIVQQLPPSPESFIHLDMVFTFLDRDACMIYQPLLMSSSRYFTIHITVDHDKVTILEEKNLMEALTGVGFNMKPIYCGGGSDPYTMEREQWHSGANFFAFAPGKVLGYERNIHTIDQLNKNDFAVLKAVDVINNKVNVNDYKRCVVTIEGSELSRGGGGCRCMSMPIRRKPVQW